MRISESIFASNVLVIISLIPIFLILTAMAAMLTHVVICIKTAAWVLLGFGVIIPPIGIIHGIGSWFGAF